MLSFPLWNIIFGWLLSMDIKINSMGRICTYWIQKIIVINTWLNILWATQNMQWIEHLSPRVVRHSYFSFGGRQVSLSWTPTPTPPSTQQGVLFSVPCWVFVYPLAFTQFSSSPGPRNYILSMLHKTLNMCLILTPVKSHTKKWTI